MANGDAAAAAGMDVVPATEDRRNGYDEINKTRDYIAGRVKNIDPSSRVVSVYGTAERPVIRVGSTDYQVATTDWVAAGHYSRADIDAIAAGHVKNIDPSSRVVSVYGTAERPVIRVGSTDYQVATTDWVAAVSLTWSAITGKPSTFPPSSHTHNASDINAGTLDAARINNSIEMLGTQNGFGAPNGTKAVFARNDGQFYTNGIRASGGASGWNNVGVNADGRLVDTNSSTRRLKENIEPFDPNVDGDFDALQVSEFDWKDGTGHAVGVMAEDVEAAGYGWLVTRELDGRVSGVQYDRLVLILIPEVQRLRRVIDTLEERLTRLEQA